MLEDVVVQVVEGLDFLQVLNGDGYLVVELYECDEVYQVDAVQLEGVLQVGIRSELALFDFELFSQFTFAIMSSLVMLIYNYIIYNLLSAVFDNQR